ncbi:MAG: O-antigen ligase family protein [Kiritimatiellia bacterium]
MFLYLGILPLLFVPVWMGGGAFPPWQGSFLWLGAWAWGCYFLQPATKGLPSRKTRCLKLVKDPLLWISLGFLGYLTLQHLNTGRVQIFDFDLNEWRYSDPPVPWLPSSITRSESHEMIRWFAPILTLLMILRQSWKALPPPTLMWLVCLNGFCNVMLAFTQEAMGWSKMYNLQRFGDDFYASFGYPNHAALYFILLFSLALGLFLKEILSESSDRDLPTLFLSAVLTLTFFIAANLSTSRAGILGSWLVLILSLLTLSVILWPRTHPVQKIYGFIAVSLGISFLITAFLLLAKPIHFRELRSATLTLDVYNEIEGRFFQIESAFKLWMDHPLYGVGGWGYRYLGSHYMPMEEWHQMLRAGKANVHNDWMQFGAEFGIIGLGLLLAAFFPLLRGILSSLFKNPVHGESIWADPLKICVFWGLVMLFLDSQFDIPLRSPAVFMHGLFLLFLLSPHPDSRSLWLPLVDWKRLQPPALRVKNQLREIHPEKN